jgi:hypothetical protein
MKEYYKLLAPNPGPHTSAMEDSDTYAEASMVIKRKLEAERGPTTSRLRLGINGWVGSFIRRPDSEATAD